MESPTTHGGGACHGLHPRQTHPHSKQIHRLVRHRPHGEPVSWLLPRLPLLRQPQRLLPQPQLRPCHRQGGRPAHPPGRAGPEGPTRHALELIDAYDCGVSVDTKSDLIVRDVDLYQSIQTHSPVICKITVTTVDEELAAKVEPRAPSPARRLEAIRKLAEAGIFCGVLLMPVLPFLEDRPEQVLSVVDRSADAGAKFIYSGFGVTMRQGQGTGTAAPPPGPGSCGRSLLPGAGSGGCCTRCPTSSPPPRGITRTGSSPSLTSPPPGDLWNEMGYTPLRSAAPPPDPPLPRNSKPPVPFPGQAVFHWICTVSPGYPVRPGCR